MIGDDGAGEGPTVRNDLALRADDYVSLSALVVGIFGTVVFMYPSQVESGARGWKIRALVSVLAFLIWGYAVRADA